MHPEPRPHDFAAALLAAGDRYLVELGPAVDRADPERRVEPRSRALCAALGVLGETTYRALGGSRRCAEVGRAAAMLSLLTKIDDQVIDAPAFHGGAATDRDALRRRTRAFLAPTLASLRAAQPVSDEPRCAFAADLGRALRALAGGVPQNHAASRLEHLVDTIAAGWEIQVEAVAVLTSHPGAVSRAEVAAITRKISGAWLLMIAMVGSLPDDAARPLSAAEEASFFAWGSAIQRADALADLQKDLADGHLASYPGRLLWERAPTAYLSAVASSDIAAVYRLVRAHRVDRDCLPDARELRALGAELAHLGEVGPLLAWIHAHLAGRYRAHPLSAPRAGLLEPPLQSDLPAAHAAKLCNDAPKDARCSAR